jgi:5-bromo-4-chloroindolyl phosphate hydrolysis protein
MDENKDGMLRTLLPGIIGGSVFIIFAFIFGVNIFVSIGLGLAGFIAGGLVFGAGKKDIEMIVDGITKQKYNEVMRQGKAKLAVLGSFIAKVKDVDVKKKVKEITDVVEKIFLDIEKDPKDIKPAREFLTYYLDTTINILNRYIEISGQNLQSKKISDMLERVEGLLDAIKKAFEKQLEKLLTDDMLDLDSDIKVLEQTIKSEMLE